MQANLARSPKSKPKEIPESILGPFDEPGIAFTATGLVIEEWVSFDQWARYGRKLQLVEKGIQWAIGDWIIHGENKWGEDYAQAVEVSGLKVKTIQNYASVARAIPKSRRRDSDEVDFSTHAEVACLDEEDQERILARAAKEHTTRRTVRREVERIRRAKRAPVSKDELVLSAQSREFLDDYMTDLAGWTDKLPIGVSESERETLEKMIYSQGADVLWVRSRTRETDYNAIAGLFSFDEGTPGMERAQRSDISAWLEKCGFYMSDSDLDERLDLMVEMNMLEVHSVEESRQDGRRGVMLDLYALSDEYEAKMDAK